MGLARAVKIAGRSEKVRQWSVCTMVATMTQTKEALAAFRFSVLVSSCHPAIFLSQGSERDYCILK
jgi:hypothetical protein